MSLSFVSRLCTLPLPLHPFEKYKDITKEWFVNAIIIFMSIFFVSDKNDYICQFIIYLIIKVVFAEISFLYFCLGASKSSRLAQLIKWCGDDFNGCLIFDESHKAKHFIPVC